MHPRRLLSRRPSTPSRATVSSRPGHSLPSDVVGQTCRRLGIVGIVFASLWALAIFMNTVVAGWFGEMAFMKDLWPFPGLLLAAIGIASSIALTVLAHRLSGKPILMDVGAGFLVLQCLLASILSQWSPVPISTRVSWVCILILFYPAIVPNTPRKTLVTSLLAASTEPLVLYFSHLRGVQVHLGAFYLLWDFLPNYLCAFLSVIPVKIIHQLGHQVRRARELGSYRLEEPLGRGGMGEVFRATHQMLARPAAVKLIRSEILGSSSAAAARVIVERFRREAEAAASLRSPHTISLYDFGVANDGTFFLVMELLDGLDLETLVERFGPVPPERVVHLLRQACASLEEAHIRGLVHRDIKPSNIFTCRLGLEVDFVKVLDFGLVKAVDDVAREATLLTAPDSTTGTPAYIAPEVVRGDRVADHRVDIYTLGCVGYWLLTGRLVFQAPNAIHLMYQHANASPVPPSQRSELEIPAELDSIILACLAKYPEDRPQTAGELSRRLATAVSTPWTEEQAQRWWDRHHPASVRTEPADVDKKMLTKTMDAMWESVDTPAPTVGAGRP
ncbi:MAG: eukaryotic-like serine/threonine-protein kinase [Gemmatimonadales bacterium]|nr:eukaryotic-like serine/threonine-protein kinase [Gemmatimonadales bacterium]